MPTCNFSGADTYSVSDYYLEMSPRSLKIYVKDNSGEIEKEYDITGSGVGIHVQNGNFLLLESYAPSPVYQRSYYTSSGQYVEFQSGPTNRTTGLGVSDIRDCEAPGTTYSQLEYHYPMETGCYRFQRDTVNGRTIVSMPTDDGYAPDGWEVRVEIPCS